MLTRTAAVVALAVALAALVVLVFTHVATTPRALTLTDLPNVAKTPERGHHARGRHSSPAATGEKKARPGGKDAAPASAAHERKAHRAKPAPDEPEVVLAPETNPPPIVVPPAVAPKEAPKEAPLTAPARPAPAGVAPDPDSPLATAAREFVEDYYAALDRREFGVAWNMLSPEAQRAFGGFAGWRKGYAHTLSSSPGGFTVASLPTGAMVLLTLRAGDRGGCGQTTERRFSVTWRLARTAAGWRATAATALKLSGPEPC